MIIISKFNSTNASSTIFIVSSFVILRPFINLLDIFFSFNFLLIKIPPPCIKQILRPNLFRIETSCMYNVGQNIRYANKYQMIILQLKFA